MPATDTQNRDVVITRTFHAPRELVWRAWTDPDEVVTWWGPDGFTTTSGDMDLRPGGEWRFVMHGPDGRDYPNRIVFEEVVEPERLVYRHDDGGEAVEPISFRTEVTFEAQGESTRLTLRQTFPSTEARERVIREYGAFEGGLQHVARLGEHLVAMGGKRRNAMTMAIRSDREVVLRRAFDAPRELVFEAFSKPEHIRNWWGCGKLEMTECDMDFRAGGSWRFVQREDDGTVHPFKGEYREIVAPERIVQTFIYDVDGAREHPAVETILFEAVDGGTLLTNHMRFDSAEAMAATIGSGMEGGAAESMDRLEELVASMTK